MAVHQVGSDGGRPMPFDQTVAQLIVSTRPRTMRTVRSQFSPANPSWRAGARQPDERPSA